MSDISDYNDRECCIKKFCYTPVMPIMIFGIGFMCICAIILFTPYPQVHGASMCPGAYYTCGDIRQCCDQGCCSVPTDESTGQTVNPEQYNGFNFQTSWYTQWPSLLIYGAMMSMFVCCSWCSWRMWQTRPRMYSCFCACCMRRPPSDRDSAGSCYPPPRYSRCGSFHHMPPPYSEVTSKPDLYPLVIACGEGDKSGASYLMVQYYRNSNKRPPASLSATSTAESLNSSFICNATNEANSIIPPPYSFTGNYDQWRYLGAGAGAGAGGGGLLLRSRSSLSSEPRSPRSRTAPAAADGPAAPADLSPDESFRDTLISSPIQATTYDLNLELIDYELGYEGARRPRLGASPPAHRPPAPLAARYERDVDELRRMFTTVSPDIACDSPPRPTSPTQSSRDSTLRRHSDERRRRRSDRRPPRSRKASLYMPIAGGARAASRSAPATPCAPLVPSVLAFSQRASASRSLRLREENDPLLDDDRDARFDHKF